MDAINALFELGGAFAVIPSIIAAWRAKQIVGISIATSLFFTSWGWWNIFYYPSLDQTLSAMAAGLLAGTNSIWLYQIWYYGRTKPTRCASCENGFDGTGGNGFQPCSCKKEV